MNEDSQVWIASLGDIQTVPHAMSARLKAMQVQEGCCSALALLAGNADNQARIAPLGGIQAVLHVLSAHLKALQVQEGCCPALACLAVYVDIQVKIAPPWRYPDGAACEECASQGDAGAGRYAALHWRAWPWTRTAMRRSRPSWRHPGDAAYDECASQGDAGIKRLLLCSGVSGRVRGQAGEDSAPLAASRRCCMR